MTGNGDFGIICDDYDERIYINKDGKECDYNNTHLMSEEEADKLCAELNKECGQNKYQVAIEMCL